ncbi:HTH-type transcriptional repressor KstR2 [Burkholderiales bacterium]|nr:HTH-type transcriptional repressor KstR2 [Burkholderiales bacterium]
MKMDDSVRRQELLSSAARLFRDVGYARATVRDIAKAVGIQSGSIFYYFKTKEDILVDVMETAMQAFVGAAQRALRDASTPRGKLRELFVGHLKALHGSTDETAVVLSEWRSLSPKSRRRIVKLRDQVDGMWDEALRDASTAGLVRGDLRLLRLAMLGSLNWSLQWYAPKGGLSIEELADRFLDFFVSSSKSRG